MGCNNGSLGWAVVQDHVGWVVEEDCISEL